MSIREQFQVKARELERRAAKAREARDEVKAAPGDPMPSAVRDQAARPGDTLDGPFEK
ncbi:hypothetical protein ACWGCI_10375 [Streptomyces sp. NPDC054949]|uniref:hypothetical protein n=1 Tax=unclassified Streptomyces TaxID=2593676 RepID=UPI000A87295E|nr:MULTISPECIES: hypothetical protein [unclassified Streptomyces]MCX5074972.1 hypothetical protein [Streptomyces sp. NBC_00424]MCX5153409.1 hypothetical protein [Streptomyces sp. NBC_00291]WUD41873.1 hypothetical protein OHA84_15935 [Streptomyces sp. NBC_00513]